MDTTPTPRPPKQIYRTVTYVYADPRVNAGTAFVSETFFIDEGHGGGANLYEDSRPDTILPCQNGFTITVRTGWLWREVGRGLYDPMPFRREPNVVPFPAQIGAPTPTAPDAPGGASAG